MLIMSIANGVVSILKTVRSKMNITIKIPDVNPYETYIAP
jgi:hypothetical protein